MTGDREAKQKAVKAVFPKLVEPVLADMQALRKDIVAERVPEAIASDKDELLKRIDKFVELMTKALKEEIP